MLGTVKWFNDKKGYGFISTDEEGPDVFLHYTDIDTKLLKSVEDGARVEFSVTNSSKGMRAIELKVVSEE